MNKQLSTNAEQNLNLVYASYQILNFALIFVKRKNSLLCYYKRSETKVYEKKRATNEYCKLN